MQTIINEYGIVPDIIGTSCTNSIRIDGLDFRVPCGQCYNCKKKRRSEWSLRLEHEYMFSDSAFFITLTYNDASLPNHYYKNVSIKNEEGEVIHRYWKRKWSLEKATLNHRHVQSYIKRLREANNYYIKKQLGLKSVKEVKKHSKPLRYYAVGEYGSKFGRPHYHILLFNMEVANIKPITEAWKNTTTGKPLGFVHIGKVSSASINYVTKYMFKWEDKKEDRQKPFSLMSKKNIIGWDYIKNYKDIHLRTNDIQIADNKGNLRRMPRAYAKKIFVTYETINNKLYAMYDVSRFKKLSKKLYDKYQEARVTRYLKHLEKNFNNNEIIYMQSILSDIERKKVNINFKETL